MTKPRLIALGAAAIVAVFVYRTCGSDCRDDARPGAETISPAHAPELLIDRNWMDRWPESATERLHVYRFVPQMGGGVYQDRTLFKGTFELFKFEVAGDHVEIYLPETDEAVTVHYRIDRVDGPAPFDLRLTLDPSPRGPAVLYGRSAETAADAALFLTAPR